MKNTTKIMLVLLATIALVAAIYPLLGCCTGGCGGCCGSDDASEDTNSDGSSSQEQVPTTLGQTTTPTTTGNERTPTVCDGITTNSVSATASKSGTQSGYAYSYSYTIRACASTIGYAVILDGASPYRIESNSASKARETTGSNSYQSTQSFTRLCIKTTDTSIGSNGEYCVPFS